MSAPDLGQSIPGGGTEPAPAQFDGAPTGGFDPLGGQPADTANFPTFGAELVPSMGQDKPPAAPRNIGLLQPPMSGGANPLGAGGDVANVVGGFTVEPSVSAFGAGNLVPVLPIPVLSRFANIRTWVIPVPIVGKTSVTVRAAYADLHISPGVRGIQIQYGTTANPVLVTCNATGMTYSLPNGPKNAWLPLYMLESMIDVTISCATAFPAGSSCLLCTEEQVPFAV